MSYRPKEATPVTASINKAGEGFYPLHDRHDFHDARLNLIAPIPDGKVFNEDGAVVFDLGDFAYLTDDAPRPDTVDASLWRTSQVIHEGGLYKVVDRIYSDLARIDVTPQGLVVRAMVPGLDPDTLQRLTAAPLHFDVRVGGYIA